MGTADNTHYPSPSIPSILQPPVLRATGRNRRCRNTGRETWALQFLHLMILKAISFCPHIYLVNFGIDGHYVWGHSQGCFNCILYDSKHLALLIMVRCNQVKFYGNKTICWKPLCVFILMRKHITKCDLLMCFHSFMAHCSVQCRNNTFCGILPFVLS